MARKNIFEQLCDFDLSQELKVIDKLINENYVQVGRGLSGTVVDTIVNFFDQKVHRWAGRNTSVSNSDIRRRLNIDKILNKSQIEIEEGLAYLEYAFNVMEQFRKYFEDRFYEITNLDLANDNCQKISERLGFSFFHDNIIDTYILAPENPSALVVAELLSEETSTLLMKYHHYLLKGDLQKKRDILLAMGDKYEPLIEEFKALNQTELQRDISFCLNKLHIRHNNKKGAKTFPPTEDMPDSELEEWYDRTYDLLLLGFMYHDYLINKKGLVHQLRVRKDKN
ncbi:MAG: hypothetical protein CVV46_06220 [Spirochaetae bacterium HGW-Spirochaetae-2]|jgi:hypothetical protein|nr:MAG: hypothetical protein CVV46_06220 [Spirochaetae bacterium HGW-Spirochaetae-2]